MLAAQRLVYIRRDNDSRVSSFMSNPLPPPYSTLPPEYEPIASGTAESILTRHLLVLDKYTESSGPRYVIGDGTGNILGTIEPYFRRGRPSAARFHYVVKNPEGSRLMRITRSSSLLFGSSYTEVFLALETVDEIVGVCKTSQYANRRGYALYLTSRTGWKSYRPFCTAKPPLNGQLEIIMVDRSGAIIGSVGFLQNWAGPHPDHTSYTIHMHPDEGRGMSIVSRRSVMLATAVCIDFDYFT